MRASASFAMSWRATVRASSAADHGECKCRTVRPLRPAATWHVPASLVRDRLAQCRPESSPTRIRRRPSIERQPRARPRRRPVSRAGPRPPRRRPTMRLAVDTTPSLAPSTAARSQPIRSVRCFSRCLMSLSLTMVASLGLVSARSSPSRRVLSECMRHARCSHRCPTRRQEQPVLRGLRRPAGDRRQSGRH